MKKASDKLKENIFHTPEGYFDQLPGRIQEKISEEQQSGKTIPLVRWTYAVAASVLILWVAGTFFYQQSDQSDNTIAAEQKLEQLMASVSDEEILNYLQAHTELNAMELTLTEDEQQEILLNELESYDIPLEDYEYEAEYIEEYL